MMRRAGILPKGPVSAIRAVCGRFALDMATRINALA
jgi:hypothetical protein